MAITELGSRLQEATAGENEDNKLAPVTTRTVYEEVVNGRTVTTTITSHHDQHPPEPHREKLVITVTNPIRALALVNTNYGPHPEGLDVKRLPGYQAFIHTYGPNSNWEGDTSYERLMYAYTSGQPMTKRALTEGARFAFQYDSSTNNGTNSSTGQEG